MGDLLLAVLPRVADKLFEEAGRAECGFEKNLNYLLFPESGIICASKERNGIEKSVRSEAENLQRLAERCKAWSGTLVPIDSTQLDQPWYEPGLPESLIRLATALSGAGEVHASDLKKRLGGIAPSTLLDQGNRSKRWDSWVKRWIDRSRKHYWRLRSESTE